MSEGKCQKESKGNFKLLKPKSEPVTTYDSNTPTWSKSYFGTLPDYTKCNYHHVGDCEEIICSKCKLRGHISRYCRKIQGSRDCYECNQSGHCRKDCPKLKKLGRKRNNIVIDAGDVHQDPVMVTGMFLLNNNYVFV